MIPFQRALLSISCEWSLKEYFVVEIEKFGSASSPDISAYEAVPGRFKSQHLAVRKQLQFEDVICGISPTSPESNQA
jgi:hypothetical protein